MRALCLVAAAFLLASCTPTPSTGPVEITWDRDPCDRCNMAIGDRRFAAQVRLPGDSRVHRFDDLGCALLWLDDREDPNAPVDEIWVRALDGERWLDARKAHYVAAENTPMGYGFGAIEAESEDSVDIDFAHEAIALVERGRRSAPR